MDTTKDALRILLGHEPKDRLCPSATEAPLPIGEVLPPTEPSVKYFAIIGTRQPDEAQAEVAYHLAWAITHIGGHWVNTGAADGIDKKAMEGTLGHHLQVFLPWSSYNRESVPRGSRVVVYTPAIHGAWTDSVSRFHPAADRLSRGAIALHARNYGIIEGTTGVVALPGSEGGGGTGQGIRIAKALGITIIQGNKGTISDAPRFIGQALQKLGLASPDLAVTLTGRTK